MKLYGTGIGTNETVGTDTSKNKLNRICIGTDEMVRYIVGMDTSKNEIVWYWYLLPMKWCGIL